MQSDLVMRFPIWSLDLISHARLIFFFFQTLCLQECSPEPIFKISAPQGFMGWLGFLCSGMELAGKPASKQFLAY